MEAAVWGFLGTLVGAAASIGTSWISSRQETVRQAKADSLERMERSRAFQRENLLAVQDGLQEGIRLLGRMFIEFEAALLTKGQWGNLMLTEELSEGVRDNNSKLSVVVERIAADELRASIKRLRDKMTSLLLTRSHEEGRSAVDAAVNAYSGVMEQLGATLRSLY